MNSFLAVCFFILAGDRDRCVALVQQVSGEAEVRLPDGSTRPLVSGFRLHAGDKIVTKAAGRVKIMVLADGHHEEISEHQSVTAEIDGCTPTTHIKREKSKLPARVLSSVRASGGRAASATLRSDPKDEGLDAFPPVIPIYASNVLTQRPNFSWQPLDGATEYVVHLFRREGANRVREWKSDATAETKLSYPKDQKEIDPGTVREWEVWAKTTDGDKQVAKSKFNVADKLEMKDVEAIMPLERGTTPEDWSLAAIVYEQLGAYDDALRLYKKLVVVQPGEAAYWISLSHYYARAGLPEEAAEARKKAESNGLEHLERQSASKDPKPPKTP